MRTTAFSLGQTEHLTPRAALERLFVTERIQREWFDSSFLSNITISHLEQVLSNSMARLGAYQRVQEAEGEYLVIFDQGVVPTKIALNLEGRITGLLFQSPRTKVSSPEEALQRFKTLSGRVGLLIVEDGQERISLNPDTPLAVASSFKLVVLAALNDQIQRKWRSWRDVIELKPESKSLPSGVLQTWPDGAPLTLDTLATLMISQSDNTATDALIDVVGRETLESIAPRNRPFLTTREAFILKDPDNKNLLESYQTRNEVKRRMTLEIARTYPLPLPECFTRCRITTEVEWFFTSRELCSLMEMVANLPLMGINPGLINQRHWARIAFKGGSEPGVLSLTSWLQARDGRTFCVAGTWNDKELLDKMHFFALYNGLLEALT